MPTATEQRLDVWLANDRGMTRHAAQVLIHAGRVTVNGRLGRSGQRVRAGDVVAVRQSAPEASSGTGHSGRPRTRNHLSLPQQSAKVEPLVIVYEDESLAVVDKPAGIVVHPAPGHPAGTLADQLREHGATWSLLGGEERPGIVHRLDKDTSGLLVVAKSEAAHRALAAQLRDRTLGRVYWAAVRGGFRENTGTIDAPLARHPRDRKRMAVVDGGREAITDFRVDERLGDASVLEVRLRTGRTHQIRVHFAYIRHPLVGDAVYGQAEPSLDRLALHARELHFMHPEDGSPRMFTSPLPAELQTWLAALRASRQ